MAAGEPRAPADVARWDQVEAAQREVLAALEDVAPQPERWSRAGDTTVRTIERLVRHLAAQDPASGLTCPHATDPGFDRAPCLLVLDGARGLLACERCYPQLAGTWPDDVPCFDCGQLVGGFVWHDLYVACGPVLAVGALCARCRGWRAAGSTVAFRRDN
ncbi:MAG: hypothetical protein MUF35_04935 [Candidatus Nanopelagicales bacterium]|jgi:hypothetical protein|nr:hypothetical protein [Candidatus Nanopelagicales bacterium]